MTVRLLAGPSISARYAHILADNLLRPLIAIPHVSRGGTGVQSASLIIAGRFKLYHLA